MKTTLSLRTILLSSVFTVCLTATSQAQVVCSDDTPYFYVDLSNDADSVYLSPTIQREGSCCGSMPPDVCIEFTILLASSAVGLEFDIFSGAQPPGALFYQIDCGQIVAVGEEICLQGGQEYTLTFCKPGANQNVYSIRSIQAPIVADTVTTRVNCGIELGVDGPIDSTIVWRDVTSMDGIYDAYLSCTMGCDTTFFTPDENSPPIVLYEVCGTYVPENCDILPVTICDTVLVNVLPEVQANLSTTPIYFCEDNIQSVTPDINLPEENIVFAWYDNASFVNGGPPIATGASFTPQDGDLYWLVATDTTFQACNMDTTNVEVIVQTLPEFSFPNSSVICTGASESVLLPSQYTYDWSPAETVTQTPNTNIYTLSPAATTVYTLTATDSIGCSASNSLVVEVIPEFNVNLTTSEVLFCADNILPIQAEITGPGGDVSLEWYDTETNELIATGPTLLPPGSGTYQIIATNNDLSSCNVDVAEVSVTIQPLPSFVLPPELTLCEGESAEIELADGLSYTWTPSSSVSPIPGTNRFLLQPQVPTTYTVTATDNVGCTFDQDLTVEVVPTFGVAVEPTQYLFCADNVLPVEAQLTGLGGNVTFRWYDAATNQFLFTGQSYLPPTTGEYYVVATHNDYSACNLDTAYAAVTIQPLPIFELPDGLELCNDESTIIELADGYSYSWTPSGSVNNIPGTNQYELSPPATTTYTILAQDAVGCSSSDELPVEVFPEFGVAVVPNQVVFCEGNVQPVQAQLVGSATNVTYRWYDATTNLFYFTGQAFFPPASGQYYVVATSNAVAACNQDTAFLEVQIQPAPAFDLPTESTLCEGESLSYTLADGYDYSWSPNSSVTPVTGTNTFELSPDATTDYTVTASDPLGCLFTATTSVEVIPAFTVNVASPTVEFCADNVMPVEAQLSGVGGNIQVRWYNAETNVLLFTGTTFLPPAEGSYLAVATHFDLPTCNTDTANLEVIINPLPEFELAAVLENCGGNTTTLTLPVGNTYSWGPTNGINLISGSNVFELNPTQSTAYTVTAQNAQGCTSSNDLQLNVGPAFNVSTDVEDVTFCENEPVSITAQINGQGGMISFSWYDSLTLSVGGAPLAGGNTFSPPNSGSFAVVAVNEDFAICNTDTAWVNATVEAAPEVDLPSLLEVCSGSSFMLALPADYTYTWVPDNGITPLTDPGQFSILPGSDVNYTVVAENTAGCATAASLPVDLLPAPIADAGPGNELTCNLNFIQLNGNIFNNSSVVDFGWQGPAGGISEGANTLTPTVILPGWYFLQANNTENACSSRDSVLIGSNFTEPVADLPDLVEIDCNDLQAVIDGSSSSAGMNISYSWSNLDGSAVDADGTASLVVDQAGFYELEVTNNSNGCSASAITEVIALPPVSGLNYSANEICFGTTDGEINIGTVEGGTPPYLYSLNGSPFVDVTTFTELEAGTYTVGVQDANGCQWWENVAITTYERIELDLGPTVELASGDIYELSFTTNLENFLIDSLEWAPAEYLSCTACPNPIASPLLSTTFSLTLTDIFGCQASDSLRLRLIEKDIVYIPNGFSPNGDDNNDRFLIFTRPGIAEVEFLKIFDRWGNMVFEAYEFPPNEPLYGWDGNFQGEPMNPAVFVYSAKIRLLNGTTVTRKGDVTLVR